MITCDARGNPDPNGSYELKDGKVLLRDGERVRFDVFMADGANRSAPLNITDAERDAVVARAKMIHRDTHAWMGDEAPVFTDQDAARALQDAAPSPTAAAETARLSVLADVAGVQADVARRRMIDALTGAGRG